MHPWSRKSWHQNWVSESIIQDSNIHLWSNYQIFVKFLRSPTTLWMLLAWCMSCLPKHFYPFFNWKGPWFLNVLEVARTSRTDSVQLLSYHYIWVIGLQPKGSSLCLDGTHTLFFFCYYSKMLFIADSSPWNKVAKFIVFYCNPIFFCREFTVQEKNWLFSFLLWSNIYGTRVP